MKQIVLPLLLLTSSLLILTAWMKPANTSALAANSLFVNGYPLDYATFSLYNRGVLAMSNSDPWSSTYKPQQFRVALRRDGIVTKQWPASETGGIYSVQLEDVFSAAKLGDELIVEPVSVQPQTSTSAKRVIKLKPVIWFNWFRSDKC